MSRPFGRRFVAPPDSERSLPAQGSDLHISGIDADLLRCSCIHTISVQRYNSLRGGEVPIRTDSALVGIEVGLNAARSRDIFRGALPRHPHLNDPRSQLFNGRSYRSLVTVILVQEDNHGHAIFRLPYPWARSRQASRSITSALPPCMPSSSAAPSALRSTSCRGSTPG